VIEGENVEEGSFRKSRDQNTCNKLWISSMLISRVCISASAGYETLLELRDEGCTLMTKTSLDTPPYIQPKHAQFEIKPFICSLFWCDFAPHALPHHLHILHPLVRIKKTDSVCIPYEELIVANFLKRILGTPLNHAHFPINHAPRH
jgi:hypothetical protein